MFARLLNDARFALRLLRRSPGFAATLLGVLVAGIGGTTAMFSIVMAVIVRPLPYPSPDELTMVWATVGSREQSNVSYPDFADWRARSSSFRGMAAVDLEMLNLSVPGKGGGDSERPETVPSARVTGDFFTIFQLPPMHGRLIGPEDERPDAPEVAVISASLYRRRFGGDPSVVGKTIRLGGAIHTIIGVAAEGFRFASPSSARTEIWTVLPAHGIGKAGDLAQRGSHSLTAVGRRAPGVSLAQADAELKAIAKSLAVEYPATNVQVSASLADLHDTIVGASRSAILGLFAAIGLVFVVVCANVANLLLARAASRRAEMAVRSALGASRRQIVAQVITETVVVFVVASLGGTLLAYWLVGLLAPGLVGAGGVAMFDVKVDATALAFAGALALLCGLVFGLIPALEAARVAPQAVLKESATGAMSSAAQRAVRGGLVVAQVALAFALLAGGGLVLRAYAEVAATSPGFDAGSLATGYVSLPTVGYADDASLRSFYLDLEARLRARPGVTGVAMNSTLPMAGSTSKSSYQVEGRPSPAGERTAIGKNSVNAGYFRAMGIPLLRGREFDATDTESSRKVVVISKAAAARLFPGEDAIGKRLDVSGAGEFREIVGVAGDVRHSGLAAPIDIECYLPLTQDPERWMVVAVRSPRAADMLREIPDVVAAIDPGQGVASLKLMDERVAQTFSRFRYIAILLGTFAASALVLATIGLFGLVSYTTGQRTRELGIRVALGSTPERILAVVMRDGLVLLGIGLALGSLGALAIGRAVAPLMERAAAFDGFVFGSILGMLALAGVLASFLPALRAARIQPAAALRHE